MRARSWLLEVGPAALFLLAMWAKVSYLNLPPRAELANEWYGWSWREALGAVVGSLATLLVLISPTLLLARWSRAVVLWSVDLACTFAVLSQMAQLRRALGGAPEAAFQAAPLLQVLRPADALLLTDLVLATVAQGWYRRAIRSTSGVTGRRRAAFVLTGLAVGAGMALVPIRAIRADREAVFAYRSFRLFGIRKVGFLNYHLYEAGRRLACRLPGGSPCAGTNTPEAPNPAAGFAVIAHRGSQLRQPENTLASLEGAFAEGAQVVEADVRLTLDGVPVLMHDDTVDRTTGGQGALSRMTLENVKRLDAGSWKGPEHAGEPVPTLAEALRAAAGKGRLLIDPKVDGLGPAIAAVLDSLALPRSSLMLGTWRGSQVEDFVEHLQGAQILSTGRAPAEWSPAFFLNQRNGGIDGFEVDWTVPEGFLRDAQSHGMPVYLYTINDRSQMLYLLKIGVDGIETDDPAVLVGLVRGLRQEGWP